MPNRSHGRNRPHPIPAPRAFGAFQPGASDDPTASHDERCTLASPAITVARGCIATLRRAKFDIGVRSSKDGKSGAWWWTLRHPED